MASQEIPDFPFHRKDLCSWIPEGYTQKVYRNILHAIGDTPLVRLNRIPKDYGLECEIYAKCEFLNPGGSIKDRVAYNMMVDLEMKGELQSGGHLVEPTSGNTGIGVALCAAVHGYGCTIVTPDKNSEEKMNTMRLLGANVIQTPSMVEFSDPHSFISVTKKILEENPTYHSCDQYDNGVNPVTHYGVTAEEIISAVGKVDMVVMGTGTGGTLTGIGQKFKENYPNCLVVAVDPKGSTIFGSPPYKPFQVEGIGGDFVPKVLEKYLVDHVEAPNDCESFNMAREIIKKEGILCGGSSGAAMFAAIQAIRALNVGAGKKVVVVFADSIRNYMAKFVSDQWMEAFRYKPVPVRDNLSWWNSPLGDLKIKSDVPRVNSNSSCWKAISLMGADHNVAIVIDDKGYFCGAISKDSLRNKATNPNQNEIINLEDEVNLHLVKNCYKISIDVDNPTVGLVSRVLDITPFVVVVETDSSTEGACYPKGIVTADVVLDYIIHHS